MRTEETRIGIAEIELKALDADLSKAIKAHEKAHATQMELREIAMAPFAGRQAKNEWLEAMRTENDKLFERHSIEHNRLSAEERLFYLIVNGITD